MKKILVPTDFSVKSFNALQLAKEIAGRSGAQLDVIHVIENVAVGSFTSMGEVIDDPMDDIYMTQLLNQAKSNLKALENDVDFGKIGFDTSASVGNPYKAISQRIKIGNYDLVVIGSKGTSDIKDLFIGSLTDKLVRTSECPVITVNNRAANSALMKIVFASDLKGNNLPLVKRLKDLQKVFKAEIHLVKINTKDDYQDDVNNMADLRSFADEFGLENYNLHVFNHEEEEYGIVYFADRIQADMIALGVHHRTGIRRLISGGHVAEEVAEHSYRPVWTYKISEE